MHARRTGSTSRPASIDDYLAKVSDEQRVALERLRKTIRAAAPKAEECISYGIAAFRHHGMLVGFGATKTHCAFYLMSASTLDDFRQDVDGLDVSKGTIRFQPAKPPAAALVRKLVKARIAENETPR
jgi:uncharacterized protein YdhG (YjbR/CyaY superfamily)